MNAFELLTRVVELQVSYWTFWATVGSAAATLTVAFVAWYQIRRLTTAERAKTTLALIEDYGRTRYERSDGSEATVAKAYAVVIALLIKPSYLKKYRDDFELVNSPVESQIPDSAWNEYRFYHDSWAIATGYFWRAALLAHRKLIDRDLFLEINGARYINVWKLTKEFSVFDPAARRNVNDRILKEFSNYAIRAEQSGKFGLAPPRKPQPWPSSAATGTTKVSQEPRDQG